MAKAKKKKAAKKLGKKAMKKVKGGFFDITLKKPTTSLDSEDWVVTKR